jgi:hypothetical protein
MNALKYRSIMSAAAVVLACGATAWGWHGKGHYDATMLALRAVKADGNLPAFFVAGAGTVAHASLDPDNFTRPIAPEALHKAESPEHFFDVDVESLAGEPLADANIPADRYAFIELCFARGLKPNRVGLLPYAVTEWTQRLTVALAEHRKYPGDPAIRAKCLLDAGMLSHYAADLCQPLHVTIHYDGRSGPDGKSPRSGIHAKVDALLGKLTPDANAAPATSANPTVTISPDDVAPIATALLADVHPAAFGVVLPAVMAEIRRSAALVDRVYELEKQLPAETDPIAPGSAVEKFTTDRMRAATGFIASLYVTAWRDSAAIELPWWYRRPYNPPQTKP